MGEANIRRTIDRAIREQRVPIIGAPASPGMPSQKQIEAMERQACRFADALLTEGHALDAPDKSVITRLLAMRACTKVIARLSKERGILPTAEVDHSMRFFQMAMKAAIQDELKAGMAFAEDLAKAQESEA